ncbi:hypothetical protein Mapa_005822 [Marchantia paleacea]|nr:hypothetical protein Mapa_005822 [Marchantia paleacea]
MLPGATLSFLKETKVTGIWYDSMRQIRFSISSMASSSAPQSESKQSTFWCGHRRTPRLELGCEFVTNLLRFAHCIADICAIIWKAFWESSLASRVGNSVQFRVGFRPTFFLRRYHQIEGLQTSGICANCTMSSCRKCKMQVWDAARSTAKHSNCQQDSEPRE